MRPIRVFAVLAALTVGVAYAPPAIAALTRARARALVQSINLVAADVPGFTGRVNLSGGPGSIEPAGGCPGAVSQRRVLAMGLSSGFAQTVTKPFQVVASSVVVMPTVALARHAVALLRRRRTRQCMAKVETRSLKKLARENHTKLTRLRLSITTLPPPVPGGVGLRSKFASVEAGGRRLTEFSDSLVFTRGPALITLAATSYVAPFPTQLERQLTDVLASRAKQFIP